MRVARFTAVAMLVFLGFSAVVGAVPMLTDPHGQPWRMPQTLLKHSPFHSFLIPGLILMVTNGLMCFFVLFLVLRRKHGYGLWIMVQGCIQLGWLITECIMLRMVIWPHYVYGVVALILVATGVVLWSNPQTGN